ncbi:hypothetical protein [Fodinibius saliphilus]|uniref:hypothetical protein n=1 Tax=Fodinibius saliphilus TaxID=1920650 RepID=UPI001BB2B300|nr:hypothetical protein [Fodinibius saliphilus]
MGQLSANELDLFLKKLVPMLQKLNFGSIWIEEHPQYPSPPPSKIIDEEYNPNLVAEKDGIDYYFEFINEYCLDKAISNSALQRMLETSNNKWDVTTVIVIEYGSTEVKNKLNNHFNIYPLQVWEL